MNDIPGDIKSALEALDNQRRDYVWARSSAKSDNEARRMAHIAGSSFARWEDRQELNALAFKISTDRKLRADIILESVLDKAAEIKAAGLDSKKESVRQSVASEILDRLMGKATQTTYANVTAANIDLSTLSDEQVRRIADGEDILSVMANSGKG